MERAIIFDCFGVLYTGAKHHVLALAPFEHRERLDELFRQADYGYISSEQFYAQSAEFLQMSPRDFYALCQRQFIRNDRLVNEVAKLRKRHRTALLSNVNDSLIQQLFAAEELDHLFDEVILSSSIGMAKPSPEIFSYAAAKLGVAPEVCIMIDDLEENIRGAEQVGMTGVHYTSHDQFTQDLAREGIYA